MNENLIKYLDGELQGEHLVLFENQLKSDQQLQEDLKVLKASKKISEGFIEAEIYGHLAKFSSKVQAPTTRANVNTKSKSKSIYMWIGGLAAACLLTLFIVKVGQVNESQTRQDVYAMYYTDPEWPMDRGNKAGEAPAVNAMVAQYLTGQKDVLEQFRNANPDDANYYAKKYWAAEFLLKEKRYAEASALCDVLIKDNQYQSRAYYIKVMHLLSQDKEKAIAYIKTIPQEALEVDEQLMFAELMGK